MQPTSAAPTGEESGRSVSLVRAAAPVLLSLPLWLAVGALLLIAVPRLERDLADQRMRVPYPVEVLITVSRLFVAFWYLAVPLILLGVGGLGLLLASLLRPRLGGRWAYAAWCLAVLLPPTAVAALIWVSATWPTLSLLSRLAP